MDSVHVYDACFDTFLTFPWTSLPRSFCRPCIFFSHYIGFLNDFAFLNDLSKYFSSLPVISRQAQLAQKQWIHCSSSSSFSLVTSPYIVTMTAPCHQIKISYDHPLVPSFPPHKSQFQQLPSSKLCRSHLAMDQSVAPPVAAGPYCSP